MLTTEAVKSSRGQTDGFGGKYYQRYEKSHSSKFLTILQKYSKKDFIRIPLSKRRMQYEGMHVVNVSKDKHVVQSSCFSTLRKDFKTSNDSNHMSSESAQMAVPTKDIESVSVGRISLQKIVQSAKPDQDISAIVLELEKRKEEQI
ncbi:hypothetical protein FDP41_001235 [Naegleria fowleri]|uniref:Uncharacterized protein n=1 Tax=Naegleria fowleri TaxID=5763 RepID=A0A6A5BQZ5_NAEFO|nr:uncharacterized protein FDP41_001235 [Naegleria fowleri]KAF0979567.1 hypothetical protein FDP41_001235 [Naegleria fowleri]